MKKSILIHQLWNLVISISAIAFIAMFTSCYRISTFHERSVVYLDGPALDIRISDDNNQFYKTLSIYKLDGVHEKKLFSYHEDRLKVPDDSCFKINESEYNSSTMNRDFNYNLDKQYVTFFDCVHSPFFIVHFFNINEDMTFRKDKYFVFKIIGKDSISLIKTFIGKRLTYESTHSNDNFTGYIFKTNNSFTKIFFWGYSSEFDIKLPDVVFYLDLTTGNIEWG